MAATRREAEQVGRLRGFGRPARVLTIVDHGGQGALCAGVASLRGKPKMPGGLGAVLCNRRALAVVVHHAE